MNLQIRNKVKASLQKDNFGTVWKSKNNIDIYHINLNIGEIEIEFDLLLGNADRCLLPGRGL